MANTYAFNDTQVSIIGPGGSFTIGGNGAANSDEGITVEMNEDKSNMTIGADGGVMHSLHAGQGGRITVHLLKTSPVNGQLSAMYALQTASSGLHGQNLITLKNPVIGDSITAANVAFKKLPTLRYSKDGGMNDWVFDVGTLVYSLNGGGNVSNIINAVATNLPTGSL